MEQPTPCRILYMEDDPGLARILQKKLQRRGFQVDLATDGETGLEMCRQADYDLLLIDYNMPGKNGIEVLRALGERDHFPPTVMVTGQEDITVAVEAMKLGATDYLVKDVERKYLDLIPMVVEKVQEKQRLLRERAQMAETIREKEERYRSLVELTPDGIAVMVNDRLAFVNPALVKMLGRGEIREIVGQPLFDHVAKDQVQGLRDHLLRLTKREKGGSWFETHLVRPDDSKIDVEVSGISFAYEGQWALLVIFRDITQRKEAEKKLKFLAHYDGLTELPNRALFFDRFHHTLLNCKRYRERFAVLFIDLDRFKQVNDVHGHDVGDQLLKGAAERIQQAVRSSDTVARMGGDEFTVILSRIRDPENALMVAQKIVATFQEPFALGGLECSVGASVGISVFPDDGEDSESLLKAADKAMYQAKREGRGKAVLVECAG